MIVSGQASVLLPLLMLTRIAAAVADDGEKKKADAATSDQQQGNPFIIPTFFDFDKEIENIFPESRETKESQPSDYILEEGVSLERDYDFYSDVEASESNPVTARTEFRTR